MKKLIFYFTFMFILIGCGVKGDPLPPLKPTNLSKGRPKYKGTSNKNIVEDNSIFDEEESDGSEDGDK